MKVDAATARHVAVRLPLASRGLTRMAAATWIGLAGFVVVAELWSFLRRRTRAGEVSTSWLAEYQRLNFYDR